MEFLNLLTDCQKKNGSLLCVGLDSDSNKLPAHLKGKNSTFEFNKEIIDATADLVCAYKPNSAFYEAEGTDGIEQLKITCDYIKKTYSHIPIILDAKRADIGNTNEGYAKYAFDFLGVDAITVHPYLGREALEPLLARREKGIIVLCRTSNPGAGEFQDLKAGGKKVYQIVAEKVRDEWNANKNCLLVVGATYPEELAEVRKLMGNDFVFLVPGIGAQGGDVEKTIRAGTNKSGSGIFINSSRDIIYASAGRNFSVAARARATDLRNEINKAREKIHVQATT